MSDGRRFDYESAIWGADDVQPGEWSIAGYRLGEALLHLPLEGRVLEVGCGAGRFLRALGRSRPGLRLVGADLSRNALRVLAERCQEIETRLVEGPSLPAADREFDAVLALDVLEHVEDTDALLSEIRRVLVPGGVFHLHVPCEADPRSLWRWLPAQAGEPGLKRRFGGHIQRFRRRELLERIRSLGFRVLRVRNSLHAIGNVADVALFLGLAIANRERSASVTSGDVIASRSRAIRAVDALVYWEARLLGALPSWSIHVTARRPGGAG